MPENILKRRLDSGNQRGFRVSFYFLAFFLPFLGDAKTGKPSRLKANTKKNNLKFRCFTDNQGLKK